MTKVIYIDEDLEDADWPKRTEDRLDFLLPTQTVEGDKSCGANAPGGGGFQTGNTCAGGGAGNPTALPSGTMIGSSEQIDSWAAESVVPYDVYHYTDAGDKILEDGFRVSPKSERDGVYFAYDKEISNGFGDTLFQCRLNVGTDRYIDFGSPSEKAQVDLDDWMSDGSDYPGEPGTVGEFCRKYDYAVWNDGIQIGVIDPSAIGIKKDAVTKSQQ
jgi:hypothetical protein